MGLFNTARTSEQGYKFRKMKARDVDAVLDIIEAHDEDDAMEAAQALAGDLSGFFVVEAEQYVAGVTGYTRIMDAPTSAWLSWTYVHEDMRKRGVASFMIEELRFVLMKTKVERLFIETSDYKEDGVDIYADARRFYERLGASREIVIDDYYQPGEARYVYRLPLEMSAYYNDQPMDEAHVAFTDVDVLPESETAYGLFWEEVGAAPEDGAGQLRNLVEAARADQAHAVFASLPGPLATAASADLQGAGFRKIGEVSDFYSAGVHDVYWALYL